MGCCCAVLCSPCKAPVKESWFDQYKAEKFNGHTLQLISEDYFDEIVGVYVEAFGGTPETEPEYATRWILGQKFNGKYASTNDDVKAFMEYFGRFIASMAFRGGTVVGVKDVDGSLIAMAILYPRGYTPPVSMCGLMGLICGDMSCEKPPVMDKEAFPGSYDRMNVVESVIDKTDYKDSVYLSILAVSPKHQGKGLGKALLRFVCEVATREKTFAYLEADGPKNPNIYRKFGFVNEKVSSMVDPSGVESPLDIHMMKTDNPPDLGRFGGI